MTQSPFYGTKQGRTVGGGQCAGGTWMTGFRVGENGSIPRWSGIFCQTPQDIAQGALATTMTPAEAGSGGRDVEFHCPAGSYLQGMVTQNDDAVRQVKPVCVNLQSGAITAQDTAIGTQTGREPVGNFVCGAYSGVRTTADDALRQIAYNCSGNVAQVRNNFFTPEGKARCCMGLEAGGVCQLQPQSGACDRFMSAEFCPANPTHPFCSCLRSPVPCPNKFDGRCITNAGYRTEDMLRAACPDVITCQQFVTFSPEAQTLATRVEQNCPNASPANRATLQEAPLPATSALSSLSSGFAGRERLSWLWILLIIILLMGLAAAGIWWVLDDEPETETRTESAGAPGPVSQSV